jgi:hypothetical protein
MFLIRTAFWVGLVVLLLPTDARDQARLYATAAATVERISTFCDRNPRACATGAELWAEFLKKAEFGARMAVDLISGPRTATDAANTVEEHPNAGRARGLPATPRGTLKPEDLSPTWRGQPSSRGGA